MTYPAQPGQPDYGQQPGGPRPGGFPQYGQHPYGQPHSGYGAGAGGGYPPAGQYRGFGFGAPPPGGGGKKGRWIGLSAGLAVILTALGITGFWVPGFFLGNKRPESTAQSVAHQVVDAINGHDKAKLAALKCPDADSVVQNVIDHVAEAPTLKLGSVEVNPDGKSADAHTSETIHGDTLKTTLLLSNENGTWCWFNGVDETDNSSPSSTPTSQSTESSSSDSRPVDSSDPQNFGQSFLDKINSGDGPGAASMLCSDAITYPEDIEQAASRGARLRLVTIAVSQQFHHLEMAVDGTVGGNSVTGRITAKFSSGRFCVSTFTVA